METEPHQQGALRRATVGATRAGRSVARAAVLIVCFACCLGLCTAAAAAAAEPPVPIEAPEVEVVGGGQAVIPHEAKGVRIPGSTLSCNADEWEGVSSFSYVWLRDGSPTKGGGAHPFEFVVTAEDHDATISCIVTGENAAGKTEEESYNSICVEGPCTSVGSPPKNEVPPKIEGEAALGKTLTCTSGTWAGDPRPTYEYEWLQEGTSVGTGATYTVTSSNLGHTLECRVTAANSEGHASEPSSTVKVKGSAPSNTEKPEVLPLATVDLGETVTCSPGKWSGAPSPTFSYVWYRTIGTTTKAIEGAAAETYVVQEADEGASLSCEVTASNLEGKASAKSSNSEPVAESAPKAQSPPTITGSKAVGAKLTCESGEWRPNTPALKLAYQWLRDTNAISGAESSTYTVQAADEAQTLTCEVTATNGSKKAGVAVSEGFYIPGTVPKDEGAPSISGTAAVGKELTCERGTWSGTPSPTFAYQWFVNEKAISGATGTTYLVPEGDQLKQILCEVAATNSEGEATARSAAVTVSATPPGNTKAPSISGTPLVGETLTCSRGEWSGVPEPTYEYEWLLGAKVIGEKAELVVPGEAEGKTVVCAVTAKNSAGSRTKESEAVVIRKAGGTPPKDNVAPSVSDPSGDAVGDAVVCSPGEWSGEQPTFHYQWLREDVAIESATSETYTVAVADEGHTLSCRVEATNSYGQGTAQSSNSLAIPAEPPSFSGAVPVIEGSPRVGETLRCTVSAPRGEPTPTETYQWLIEEKTVANSQSLVVPAADAERGLSCRVTAENSGGKVSTTSGSVTIAGSAPLANGRPEVAGEPMPPQEGETVKCENTSWEGAPAPSFTYVWLRDGVPLGKPSSEPTYTVLAEDLGHSLSCEVTARNNSGEASAVSPVVRVPGRAPVNTAAPVIHGTAAPGEALTCGTGTWSAAPAIEAGGFSYQWLANAKPITGAHEDDLLVETKYIGQSIECEVTAENDVGRASAFSAPLKITDGAVLPEVQPPTIEGTPEIKQQLTCVLGEITGTPTPEVGYQWLRNGTPIDGQTSPTYTVQAADQGYNVACEAMATNSAGEASATSEAVHVAGVAPINTKAPSVGGQPYAGELISCEAGSWSAKPKPEYAYEWLLNGSPIAGASGSEYLVEASELGQTISCRVTVTNREGSASATSSNSFLIGTKPVHKFEHEESSGETLSQKSHKAPPAPTAAQILDALASQLARLGKGVHITSLLKRGSYSFLFDAIAPGTLQLSWEEMPKGAHASAKRKPIVVVTGSVSFASASRNTVRLHLTSAGRRLIRTSKRVKLTAKAVFAASGQSPVSWQKSFVLTR